MEKINIEIRKQLTGIIQEEVDDPDLEFLSITRVQTTSDLQESKVYFSLLDETKIKEAKKKLDTMRGFLRGLLADRVQLRVLPQLTFIPDESIKYSVDIYQKIEEIRKQDHNDAGTDTEENSREA